MSSTPYRILVALGFIAGAFLLYFGAVRFGEYRAAVAADRARAEEIEMNRVKLREVLLNDEGEIEDWLDQDVSITADSFEDLAELWDEIAEAFNEPVMFVNEDGDLEEFEEEEAEEEE